MKLRRSTQLVPANVERMVAKSRDFAADVVLLDLEDSVPANDAEKNTARRLMAEAIRGGGFRAREVNVRINGPRTKWFGDDVAAVIAAGVVSITLPHTYGLDDVVKAEAAIQQAASQGGGPEILLAVETPATLLDLEDIARRTTRITALYVAPIDFTLALGSPALMLGQGSLGGDEQLAWLRHKLLIVARAHGWNAVDAPVVSNPKDLTAVRHAMLASRALGFDGCASLYPQQIELANEVFSPSPEELAWAGETIARFENLAAGRAADSSGGRLVMVQHCEFAKSLLALAARIGSPS